MSDPVRAMLEFATAIEQVVDTSVRRLAPANDPAVEIAWAEQAQGGPTHLTVTLRSGRVIRGTGEAKLEAIVDAEDRLSRDAARRLDEAMG